MKTVHEIIQSHCILNGNFNKLGYIQLREAARLSWYKLFKTTKESFVRKWVDVEKGIAKYPLCAENILGVFVVNDCGDLKPLYADIYKNILPLSKKKKCGCTCDECACGNITDSFVQKDVVLNGDSYTNHYTTRVFANTIIEEKEEWVASYNHEGVFLKAELIKSQTTNHLDVQDCGCISYTEKNISNLSVCGCLDNSCAPSLRIDFPSVFNQNGYYKCDDSEREIHIFGANGKRSSINNVIVSYQSNGEDMLVPEYAETALIAMIDYYKKSFSDFFTPQQKNEAKKFFNREKSEMLKYLYPIPFSVIAKGGVAFTSRNGAGRAVGINECNYLSYSQPQQPERSVVPQTPTVIEKVIKETIVMDNYKVIAGKVDNNAGSPVAGTNVYQNDLIKGATNLEYIIVNKNQETLIDGDFTVNFITGTITRTNQWFFNDSYIIPLTKNS